ncbi:C4b-binding protein alpha chain-like [Hyperolius riggenbachi]|uniref:C4b-binding protein alpha chain-like n=1 Tax=Hyperolius riggenbachi TaxID=752182 RepID=UPI0035A2C3B1
MKMICAAISSSWACAFLIFSASLFLGAWCDCGPPPVVANTKPIQVTSGAPEQNIVYHCDRDAGYYEIPGKGKTSTCQSNNLWTPISDICTRACGVPKQIDFAEPNPKDVESDIFLPNATVSYVCRPGYVRVPRSKNIITCLDNFLWSTPEQFCQRRACGNPGDVENANMEADDFLFGSRVTYKCNEGYRINSKRPYRDCLADGNWSNFPPQCTAVICDKPIVTANVEYYQEKDEYSFLDSVTFSCKKPLEVNGSSSVTCTATGQWSSTFPSCVAVECDDPVVNNSKKVSGFVGPYTLNSAISFECKHGFVLQGSSSISCNISSKWVPRIPKCLTVCDYPSTISYALLEESFHNLPYYFDGTTVAYNCKPGFERDPNQKNSVTCLGNSWSTHSKFCLPISCGDPGSIPNSITLSAQDFLFGSSVRYECNKGYALNSSIPYKKCQENGTWSNPDLACAAVCSLTPLIPFALLDEVSSNLHPYFNGTVVRYKCKPGYSLVEENTITCIDSSWSKPVEFCTRVSCGDPGKTKNGHVSAPDFSFGSRATYTCAERFVINATKNYRECQANGTWTRAIQCTVSCPAPDVPNAKSKSKTESPFVQHDVMEFECEEKFDLHGSNTIECNGEGQWKPSLPTCVPKHPHVGMIIGIIAGVIILLGIGIGYLVYKHFGQNRTKGKNQVDTPSVQYSHCNP